MSLLVPPMAAALLDYAPLIVEALTAIDDIVLVLGPLGEGHRLPRIMAANEGFSRACGRTPEQLSGTEFRDLLAAETSHATVADLEQAMAAGKPLRTEIELRGREGGTFWLGFHLTPVLAPPRHGPPRLGSATAAPHFVLIGKDVTERQRHAQASRTTERLFASAFLNIDAALAVATATRIVVAASGTFHRLFGAAANTLTGTHLDDLFDRATGAALSQAAAACLAGEAQPPMEAICLRQDGARFSSIASLSMIEGDGGRRLLAIALHRTLQGIAADGEEQRSAAPDGAAARGKICRIGLGDVRALLGERWAGLAMRAMMLAETVIKRRLAPQDVFSRTTDEGFLIWFGEGGRHEEISLRVARIEREMRIVLLTEFVDPFVASVSAPAAVRPAGGDGVAEVEERSRRTAYLPSDRVSEEAQRFLASVERQLPVEVEQLYGRGGQPLPAFCCRMTEPVRARMEAALDRLPEKTIGPAEADLLTLRAALSRTGGQRSCIVSLAAASLAASRTREPLIQALLKLDRASAERLTILLSGPLDALGDDRLADIGRRLKPLVRAVGLDNNIHRIGAPFAIAICDARDIGTTAGEAALCEAIGAVHAAGAKVIARGMRAPAEGRKLIELGADFLAGMAPTASRIG